MIERLGCSQSILTADPKGNYLAHKSEIDTAVQRVLDSGWYILGHEVASFEQELSDYLAVGHTIGTGSGTDALHLALRACGIGNGDAVITASHTSVATVAAIELAGATAVLVDIDPETFVMDPSRLEETIQKKGEALRLRGIVPVHLYGHPVDMAAIVEIAERHGLFVVEDCAQSHGAEFEGKKTGAWGHIGAFSFYPTKNLGGLGDGGAICTTDPDIAERARSLREYGWKRRFVSEGVGMNTRLDELQAAILRVKLRYLDEENQRRRDLAGIYDQVLSGTTLDLPQTRGP